MARSAAPDWDAVHRDYRTGQFSNRELGRMHEVAESTIRKKAENRKWTKDLSEQVRTAVDDQLSRDAVPGAAAVDGAQRAHDAHPAHQPLAHAREAATTPPPDDATIVAAAARRGADVVRSHRAGAARLQAQLHRLADLVDARLTVLEQLDPTALAIDTVLEPQQQGGALARRRAADDGVIACAELLDTMARTFARLAATERQAFNLDGKSGTPPGLEEERRTLLTAEQRLTALRNLRARAATTEPDA